MISCPVLPINEEGLITLPELSEEEEKADTMKAIEAFYDESDYHEEDF